MAVIFLFSLGHQAQPQARAKKSKASRVKAFNQKALLKSRKAKAKAQSLKSKPKQGLLQRVVQGLKKNRANTVAKQIEAAQAAKPRSLTPFSSPITRYIRGAVSQLGKHHKPEVRAELTLMLGYKPVDTYRYDLLSNSRRNGTLFIVREYTPDRKLRSEREFTIIAQEKIRPHKPYFPSQ